MKTPNNLKFTEENVERLYRAMTGDFKYEPLEKPNVAVYAEEDSVADSHTVNVDDWTCKCPDSQYNLTEHELCKHRWFLLLKREGLL